MTRDGRTVPPRRAITFWERPQVPENEYRHVVAITIPTSSVRKFDKPIDKPIWLIEPPPSGKAIVLVVTFSRLAKGKLTLTPNEREIGYTQLRSGDFVLVLAHLADFDMEEFKKSDDAKRLETGLHTSKMSAPEEGYIGKPLRLLLMNDAEKERRLKVLDLGVTLSKKS